MKYMGSKSRYVKEILPLILANRKEGQLYVEPFVGGANVIEHVDGRRLASDCHYYLIKLWEAASLGWMPPEKITEEDYMAVKANKESYPAEFVGYVGFAMSYGGKWFGGYRRDSIGQRDYSSESFRNARKQFQKLEGVCFTNGTYDQLELDEPCIIYCDPPYYGTTKYKDSFEHDEFYSWCREMRAKGHEIFVSEYGMPSDFLCIWEKQVSSSLTKNTGSRRATERLFTLA